MYTDLVSIHRDSHARAEGAEKEDKKQQDCETFGGEGHGGSLKVGGGVAMVVRRMEVL